MIEMDSTRLASCKIKDIKKSSRIYIVSPTESELTSRGKRHPGLARFLTSCNWKVNYISTTFNHAEKTNFSEKSCLEAKKNTPYRLEFLDVGKYERNLSFKRILWHQKFSSKCYFYFKDLVNADDILIVPSRPPELIYAAARLKRKTDVRLILDIRDIWPDALSDSSRIIKYSFGVYCNFFLRRAVAKFDAFIHVAPSFIPWLHRYSPKAQSVLVPLGFDENRWGEEPPVSKYRQGDVFRLVYCGTLTNQFDIMPVLQAMLRRRGRFHLTLIGDNGTGERYADVMNFIRTQNLESDVELMGLLAPDQLVKELSSHDITIVPMVSGALPNKVFDSIAAGLPIISLGTGDCSMMVEQYDFGWTGSFNSESVCEVFDKLTHESIRQKTLNVLKHRNKYMHQNLFEKYARVIVQVS